MFPFFGFRQTQRMNQVSVSRAMEKFNNNTLTVEDILDDEDLISEMKSYTYSQLMNL